MAKHFAIVHTYTVVDRSEQQDYYSALESRVRRQSSFLVVFIIAQEKFKKLDEWMSDNTVGR